LALDARISNSPYPTASPFNRIAPVTITITTAPCCWGVDDVNNPNLPAWERVFDEAAAAGYGGLELGPYGYVPLDHQRVAKALASRNLFIVAGTIFDDLVSLDNRENLMRQTDEICALITRLPQPEQVVGQRFEAPYLTVMGAPQCANLPVAILTLCFQDWIVGTN
jgi:inosose dehydratase